MTVSRTPARRSAWVAALVASSLLGLAACGGEEQSAPADASTRAGSAEPAAQPGAKPVPAPEAKVTQDALPSDFPSDFPVYPGSKPGGSIGLGKGPMIASFSTGDGVAEVVSFYDGALGDGGWTVSDSDAKAGTLKATKGGRSAIVRASAGANGTNIAVVLEGS